MQLEIGSSANLNSPMFWKAAHQKTQNIDPASTTSPPAKLSTKDLKVQLLIKLVLKKAFQKFMVLDSGKIHLMISTRKKFIQSSKDIPNNLF